MSGQINAPIPGSPEDWVRHAKSDLHFAKIGSNDPEVLPNQVGFHAQQAAEKALKAVLLHRQISFTRTHDLNARIRLLEQSGITWPTNLESAKDLTPYAVQTRYPGYVAQITQVEIQTALEAAEAVLTWSKGELGLVNVDENDRFDPDQS